MQHLRDTPMLLPMPKGGHRKCSRCCGAIDQIATLFRTTVVLSVPLITLAVILLIGAGSKDAPDPELGYPAALRHVHSHLHRIANSGW